MNFYPHHIKDFNNSTRHLTRVERSVYRDAIELYYDTEQALTRVEKDLSRRLICRSDEEIEALKTILDEFFEETDEGYFHERCDSEITKYRANISSKAKAGIASAEARKKKAAERKQKATGVKSRSTGVHNQEPLTNNQEDKEKDKKEKWSLPEWVNVEAWTDFEDHRKQINKPLTDLSRTKAVNILQGFTDDEQQQAIDNTIQSRWSGVFPKKSTGAKNETGSSNTRPKSKAEGFWNHTKARIKATA